MKSTFPNNNKQDTYKVAAVAAAIKGNAFGEEKMYTDKQVLSAIKGEEGASQRFTNWFFETTRPYAFNKWKGAYPRLEKVDWDEIFATVNSTLTIRVRKDTWTLKKASLKTYYTELVYYAILDYLKPSKTIQTNSLASMELQPSAPDSIEKEERVEELTSFLKDIIKNTAQVQVLLLVSKGYSHQEIAKEERIIYSSVSSSINAHAKALRKIKKYLVDNPNEIKRLKGLLRT